MANLYTPSLDRATDANGNPLSGAKLWFYTTETTTPEDVYTDGDGLVVATNPVVSDSEGMFDPVFLAPGVTYRVKLTDATGAVTYYDVDPVVSAAGEGSGTYLVCLSYVGSPTAQGWMGAHKFVDEVVFPEDFAGSQGEVETDPASDYVISIRKDGIEVGTATISSSGAFTFATTQPDPVTFEAGTVLTFIAPDTAQAAANFAITLEGAIS